MEQVNHLSEFTKVDSKFQSTISYGELRSPEIRRLLDGCLDGITSFIDLLDLLLVHVLASRILSLPRKSSDNFGHAVAASLCRLSVVRWSISAKPQKGDLVEGDHCSARGNRSEQWLGITRCCCNCSWSPCELSRSHQESKENPASGVATVPILKEERRAKRKSCGELTPAQVGLDSRTWRSVRGSFEAT